jgi:serine/threonine protein kinase
VQDFLQVLEQSGLATPELLTTLRQRPQAPGGAQAVARELVQSGVLTRWQAGQLLHGFSALAIGKYRLLEQLESGPWGRAYLAEHMPMGRRHVLRVLSREWAAQPQRVQQFLDAARRVSRLDHPHLCHVYDVSHEGNRPYLVLEYVEGQTLQRRVEREGALAPAEAVAVAMQVAAGLAHAHQQGIYHPGLDPSQVVGDAAGIIKVIGLGDVRALPADRPATQTAENDGSSEGRAGTMPSPKANGEAGAAALPTPSAATNPLGVMQSPQRRAGQLPTAADDVYALGSTLVFLLTGRPAEDAEQAGQALAERRGIPEALIALCRRMMAAVPDDRPPSMAAVQAELERLANELARPASEGPAPQEENVILVDLVADTPTDDSPQKAAPATLEDLRNLPIAKPLPSEDALPVIGGSKPAQVGDQVPVVTVSVAAKNTPKKKPTTSGATAANPKASARPDPAAGDAPSAAVPAGQRGISQRTLVMAGAAAALLLVALAGLGGYWWMAGRRQPVVAQAPDAAKPKSPATMPLAQSESNPEVAGETNPVVPDAAASASSESPTASASDGSRPPAGNIVAGAASETSEKPPTTPPPATKTASPAETPPAAAPAAVASAGAQTPTSPSPAETSSPPAGSAPASPPAAGDQVAKATPETPAKPAPPPAKSAPKAVAKPAPKPRPFDGLPTAVDLPPIPSAGDSAEAAVLGPCRVDDQALLLITLAGGAAATRNSKQRFELEPQAASGRQWEVVLAGEMPQKLATLSVENGKLTFAWQPGLEMLAATAHLLSNCALILQTGEFRHVVALRKPVLGEPLRIDLDKPASVRWTIPDLPPARQLQLILTRVEGVEEIRKEPSEPVAPGSALAVWMGPKGKPFPLGLRLTSNANNRGVTLSYQPQIKLQGFSEPRPFRRKDVPAMQQQAASELDAATKGLEQAKRDRPSSNPVKGAIEKELIEKRKTLFTEQMNNLTVVIEQLAYIAQFMEVTQGEAKIHFRISYLADDVPIDLLVTEENPPLPAGKAGKK